MYFTRFPPKIKVSYNTDMSHICEHKAIFWLWHLNSAHTFSSDVCSGWHKLPILFIQQVHITAIFYPSKLSAQASCRLDLQALSVIGYLGGLHSLGSPSIAKSILDWAFEVAINHSIKWDAMFCYWYGWMIFAHGCLLRFNSYYPSQLTCFCGICQYFKKIPKWEQWKTQLEICKSPHTP